MAGFFNRRDTPNLDLSTIGLGFVSDVNFLARSYQHFLSLNLSMNVVKKIDITFLLRFPNVQTLDLSRNCLETLDVNDQLSFRNLLVLNISHNLISSVHPFTFSNLSLEILDLSYNRLIRFWVADYEINQLFINDNKISQIEIDSGHFKEMKVLNANNNKLRIFQVQLLNFNYKF
jgi:Leucine-rich repeat (LRR) protein